MSNKRATKRTAALPAPAAPVLVLRTVGADLRSWSGFQHPASVGKWVEAPDWNPSPVCGGGIHGLPWGEGDGSLLLWDESARWQVYEVAPDDGLVAIDSAKCKFRRGRLVYLGDRIGATAYVAEHGGAGRAIVGGTATAGDGGTATAGYRGTATAGDGGTATAGDGGTATAGYRGTAVIAWWDDRANRLRLVVGYVGEGIKADVPYRVERGEMVEVKP